MRRKATLAAALCLLGLLALAGCNKLSQEECDALRTQAFDIVNDEQKQSPQACADDVDCMPTPWPGCSRPVNKKNLATVEELEQQFRRGECTEPEPARPCDQLEVYCKQGLCVHRHLREEAAETPPAATP
jgi:hypothetical protein